MKRLTFLLALLAGSSLLFVTSALAATSFSDLSSSDPSLDAIEYLQEEGVINGYPDGTFRSTNSINRAEFLKIVLGAVQDDFEAGDCFPDVNSDDWFSPYVCTATEMGIVGGYPDGLFRPEREINFAEASKMVANAFELENEDTPSGGPWYQEFVEELEEIAAIPLSINDLTKSIKRGEMSEVVWRIRDEHTELPSLKYEELEGNLVAVESCSALYDTFIDLPPYYYYYDVLEDGVVFDEEAAAPESSAADGEGSLSADSPREAGGGSNPQFSRTNVQEFGVDEADIVKTDGEFIYRIVGDEVEVVRAYPASSMEVTDQITFENNFVPSELYVDGGSLIVLGQIYENNIGLNWFRVHRERSSVYVYNVNDGEADLESHYDFDGYYNDSRKVDDMLYLVTNQNIAGSYDYYDISEGETEDLLPRAYSSGDEEGQLLADCDEILYLPHHRTLDFVNVISIPLDDPEDFESTVILGQTDNIYSSRSNLYLASTNYTSGDFYFDWSDARTLVHQFELDGSAANYEASGKVPGTILNQFSMSEQDGYFRIATTEQNYNGYWESASGVHVLDGDMELVGSLEGLAPEEDIYSTRFIGDRLYMVTFLTTDPLFVIDMSVPTDPTLLGELHIPGFSTYLHPYGENYLIGFGKDADPDESGDFAWFQGLQMSLFDVSDPENPEQLFVVGIGDRGSSSELLYNHKALFMDGSRNWIGFPVQITELAEDAPRTYGEVTFEGAHIYEINMDDESFDLQTELTHHDENFQPHDTYYYSERAIDRLLYIGDTVYAVSEETITAIDADTLEEINRL